MPRISSIISFIRMTDFAALSLLFIVFLLENSCETLSTGKETKQCYRRQSLLFLWAPKKTKNDTHEIRNKVAKTKFSQMKINQKVIINAKTQTHTHTQTRAGVDFSSSFQCKFLLLTLTKLCKNDADNQKMDRMVAPFHFENQNLGCKDKAKEIQQSVCMCVVVHRRWKWIKREC